MATRMVVICVLTASLVAGCREDDQRTPGQEPRLTYLVADDDQRLTFVLGRQGITEHLPRILDGEKLGEKWTLVRLSRALAPPPAIAADVDLAQVGVEIAHEFSADDPYTDGLDARWFRLDFATEAASTSGRLTFDRAGEGPRLDLEVEYNGQSDVYEGPSPTHVKFTIFTGFPIAPADAP